MVATAGLALVCQPGRASDLHAFWDQRCKECHGHAGDFARQNLRVEQGRLVGRHHSDNLRTFLGQHFMSDAYADRVHEMLRAQVTTPPLFKEKCARCHETAGEFARQSLALDEGRLIARSSRQPVAVFLRKHGGLEGQEIEIVTKSLERVLSETTGAGR